MSSAAACRFSASPREARGSALTPQVTTTDPSCIYSPTDFANAFLNAIPEPDTAENVEAIIGWEEAEGGNWYNDAEFNPLNTTWPYDGSVSINSVGVQSYANWTDGVTATVETIESGYFGGILSALAAGNSADAVAQAVGDSPWGTPNFSDPLPPDYDPPAPSWTPRATASPSPPPRCPRPTSASPTAWGSPPRGYGHSSVVAGQRLLAVGRRAQRQWDAGRCPRFDGHLYVCRGGDRCRR